MDTSPIVSMDALWPELTGQRRAFEVLVTLRLETGGRAFRVARTAARGTRLLVSRPGRGHSDRADLAAVGRCRGGRGAGTRASARAAGAVVTVRAVEAVGVQSSS
jgi:hypothetical protein